MEALGHKTTAMVARYSHLANEHKRKVASRLLGVVGEAAACGNREALRDLVTETRHSPDIVMGDLVRRDFTHI